LVLWKGRGKKRRNCHKLAKKNRQANLSLNSGFVSLPKKGGGKKRT